MCIRDRSRTTDTGALPYYMRFLSNSLGKEGHAKGGNGGRPVRTHSSETLSKARLSYSQSGCTPTLRPGPYSRGSNRSLTHGPDSERGTRHSKAIALGGSSSPSAPRIKHPPPLRAENAPMAGTRPGTDRARSRGTSLHGAHRKRKGASPIRKVGVLF